MRKYLHVAPGLKLPLEAATSTFSILAVRGAGKSNTAVVLAEEFYKAGIHWVAVDPKGDWWGIQSSQDGQSAGLEVPIFGGEHANVPIYPDSGLTLAELLIKEQISAVVDVSEFTKGEMRRFLKDFFKTIYKLKNRNQPPTHMIFEEVDEYLPQTVTSEIAELHDAGQRIVTKGRQRGLGATCATQRPARFHNDVLTQTDTLIAMRNTAPTERKQVKLWTDYHHASQEIVDSLPSLENGEGWVVSPHTFKVIERVQFRRRETLDTGATPEVVVRGKRRPPKMADLDVAAIEARMTEAVERARAEDPRELQKEVASLRRDLKAAQAQVDRLANVEPKEALVEVPALTADEKQLLGDVRELLEKTALDTSTLSSSFSALGQDVGALLGDVARRVSVSAQPKPRPVAAPRPAPAPRSPTRVEAPPDRSEVDTGRVKAGARRMLSVLAQFHPQPLTRRQLGTLAGVSMGGTFSTYLGALNMNGWVEENGVGINVTVEGLSAAGPVEMGPRTTEDLVAIYGRKLKAGARRMLDEIVDAHPAGLPRAELSERTSVTMGGTFSTYLGALKTNGLAEERGGEVFASDTLFIFA